MVSLVAQRSPSLVPGRITTLPEAIILRHPVPTSAGHLLAVPRHSIADALTDTPAADAFWDTVAQWLDDHGREHDLHAGITNVGDRQDVALLHVHLVCERPSWLTGPGRWTGDDLSGAFQAMRHGKPGPKTASYGFLINAAVRVSPKWRIFEG